VSLDSQLSNCVHVAPFTGPHRCPYCDEIVMATGIACLISHLLLKHRRLQLSWFSCICCMGVNALSWASWVIHWDKFHRAATSLMVVLNETSCHSRHNWGVAMLSIVTTTTILGIDMPECPDEPDRFVSAWGGYCPITERQKDLIVAIKAKRDDLLPDELKQFADNEQAHTDDNCPSMVRNPASSSAQARNPTRYSPTQGPPKAKKQALNRRPISPYRPEIVPDGCREYATVCAGTVLSGTYMPSTELRNILQVPATPMHVPDYGNIIQDELFGGSDLDAPVVVRTNPVHDASLDCLDSGDGDDDCVANESALESDDEMAASENF